MKTQQPINSVCLPPVRGFLYNPILPLADFYLGNGAVQTLERQSEAMTEFRVVNLVLSLANRKYKIIKCPRKDNNKYRNICPLLKQFFFIFLGVRGKELKMNGARDRLSRSDQ